METDNLPCGRNVSCFPWQCRARALPGISGRYARAGQQEQTFRFLHSGISGLRIPCRNALEKSLVEAAREAVGILQKEKAGPLIVLGESLGSGVASHVAGDLPGKVDGLLLVTPFYSMVDAARHHYPFLPVSWLLLDRYESHKHLARWKGRLGIVLAEKDTVVPARSGRRLYDEYAGDKKLLMAPGADHNGSLQVLGPEALGGMVDFLVTPGSESAVTPNGKHQSEAHVGPEDQADKSGQ